MILPRVWFIIQIILTVCQQAFTETAEVSQLEKFYHDKCLKKSGSTDAFTKLRTDVYEMYEYFQQSFKFLPDRRKAFCDNERSNLNHRVKVIEEDLKACLDDNDKFIGTFFKESFQEFLHFFCHNEGEYTRRFFSSEVAQCRNTIETSKTNDLDNCLNRIFAPSRNQLTQAELCDDITVTKKCFTQLLDSYCSKYSDLKNLNGVFFNYVAKPCSSCVNYINNCILIGVVLLNFIIYR